MVKTLDVRLVKIAVLSLSLAVASCGPEPLTDDEDEEALGTSRQPTKQDSGPSDPKEAVYRWNSILLETNAIDHTPVPPGSDRVYGEQFGRPRSSRAFAIVQIAVFDAFNAIEREYRSYTGIEDAPKPSLPSAAIAQAAHDTLAALYPSQARRFDAELARDLAAIPDGKAKQNGIIVGARAAATILLLRTNDGSQVPDPIVGQTFFPSNLPGKWRPDPIAQQPIALGAYWGEVRPFVIRSADQFPIPAPPSIRSLAYAIAYDEVKRLGGDGIITPTKRTKEQTLIGIYWAYDGTPLIGTPSRMSNQMATVIARQKDLEGLEVARLFALANVAEADAAIAAWDEKYEPQYWRPITGIREADRGTGPTGLGDGNPFTKGDVTWTPLGAPASNSSDPNFTPPFPAYVSGHAAFGGAFFQVLRRFYETDRIRFTFVSDELNGITRDNQGNVRPRVPRTFDSFSQAEEEEGQSRIYLGIHWRFDKTAGIRVGRMVGNYVFDHAFQPRKPWWDHHKR